MTSTVVYRYYMFGTNHFFTNKESFLSIAVAACTFDGYVREAEQK